MTEDRADMVLVPREPTVDMCIAGSVHSDRGHAADVWAAMIAAAPIPVAAKDEIERIARVIVRDAMILQYGEAVYRPGELDNKTDALWRKWVPTAERIAALHHPNVGDKMGDKDRATASPQPALSPSATEPVPVSSLPGDGQAQGGEP